MASLCFICPRVMSRYWIYLTVISLIMFFFIVQFILSFVLFNSSLPSSTHSFRTHESTDRLNKQTEEKYWNVNTKSFDKVVKSASNDALIDSAQLSFNPTCAITNQRAISAITRATTQRCKEEIANVTCLSQSGSLYSKTLPQYCPLRGDTDNPLGAFVGCFRDQSSTRVLSGYLVKLTTDNSPSKCAKICMNFGFQFAGLQYQNECFCGHELPAESIKLSPSACNMKCPGSNTHTCGGYFAIDIYKTAFTQLPKNIASPMSFAIGKTPVRIAFLLIVNGRSIRQIKRLIRNIYHQRHFYYIHVDSRQDYLYRELLKLEGKYPNIKLSRRRLSTIWGGASLLQMLLHCITDLFHLPELGMSWDYVINLSESDFPIKTLSELELFLTANKGKNFVKSHGQHTRKFISKQGLDKTFYECDTHMWRVDDRQLPLGIRWDGGSDWVGLSRDFCEYIIFEDDDLLIGLKQIFKYTLLPAESFFHTVLQNSRFCAEIIDNNLRVTNWRRKHGCKCQYKHIVDWCGCSPNDFKLQDWPRLAAIESKPHFFARKFEPVINIGIVNKIEEWLDNKRGEERNVPINEKYWQNEYHWKDSSPAIEDVKLTLYHSMAFLAFSSKIKDNCHVKMPSFMFDNVEKHLPLKFNKVNEAHLYFDNDEFKGILISFESYFGHSFSTVVHFEAFISPLNFLTIHNHNQQQTSHTSLIKLQVCSEFDPKEQLFRNFGCVLGPLSKISVLHKWTQTNSNINVTFVWIDPINEIAGLSHVHIISNETGRHFPHILLPDLAYPHQPGVWKLLVFHDETQTLLGETQFLITPLYFVNQTKVTREESKQLNVGPPRESNYIYTHNVSLYEHIIADETNKEQLKRKILKNARKSDKELLKWIIDLTSHFWLVEDICNLSELQCNQTTFMRSCSSTHWSSYSLDSKSEID